MFEDFFSRHERAALQLSTGKDSAACLYLLEPFWDKLTVVWLNAGKPLQESLDYMEGIRAKVPNFLEVRANQPEWIRINGYPADVLPYEATKMGACNGFANSVRFSETFECCKANMWMPMAQAMKDGGFTGVIRGQKLADDLKSSLRSGAIVDGIEYLFPIESWSDSQVFAFLGDRVPGFYKRGLPSSQDCANCTGYVKSHAAWIPELLRVDTETALEVLSVREQQRKLLSNYLQTL